MLFDIALWVLIAGMAIIVYILKQIRTELDVLHEQFANVVDFMWETYNKTKNDSSIDP